MPADRQPLRLGATFSGRFRVEARAGAGGMGTVYRATDLTNHSVVALKMIDDAGLARDRFQREVGMLRELTHPGIVRYVDHGIDTTAGFYLVMEWVEGRSLANVLDTEGLSVAEAVTLLGGVADAVAAAHRLGMVHRDLKPDNIMLEGSEARVRVIDFGIARRLREANSLTRTGTMVGTPGYVAPEQARGDAHVDQRVDVFALGCVLYECLTGRAAYAGQSLMARLAKVLLGAPPTLEDRCPEAPPELATLLGHMLALNPAARLKDAGEVAAALAAIGPIADGPRRPCTMQQDNNATRVDSGRPGGPQDRDDATAEQPLIALVLVGAPEEDDGTMMPTITVAEAQRDAERMKELATAAGAQLHLLADGSAVATISGNGAKTIDQAVRCARSLRTLVPDGSVALTIERRVSPRAIGSAIDRGVESLGSASLQSLFAASQGDQLPAEAIRVDPVAAQLLKGRAPLLKRGADTYLVPGDDDRR
jgi:hypothetical protein